MLFVVGRSQVPPVLVVLR